MQPSPYWSGTILDTILAGRFPWHELLTTDPDGATLFCARAIGCNVEPYPQDPTYQLLMAGGKPMGGLMLLPEGALRMGAPPQWLSYISTPNVDAASRQHPCTPAGSEAQAPRAEPETPLR